MTNLKSYLDTKDKDKIITYPKPNNNGNKKWGNKKRIFDKNNKNFDDEFPALGK